MVLSGYTSFFFNHTAPTEIYTLSLHDALPIRAAVCRDRAARRVHPRLSGAAGDPGDERTVVAVVLLAHHAADRARIFLRAHADARRRRRGRAEIGRAHV